MAINIKNELEGLRGKEYYDRWADLWAGELQHVKQECAAKKATGSFIVSELVAICDKHDLPWKPFVLQLEKEHIIRTGLFDVLPAIGELRKIVAGRTPVLAPECRPTPQNARENEVDNG